MVSLKKFNEEIANKGIDCELAKGDGYFFFIGDAIDTRVEASVMVNAFSHLSITEWWKELEDRLERTTKLNMTDNVADGPYSKVFRCGQEVKSTTPILNVAVGSVGVVTNVDKPGHLYTVIFRAGSQQRYLYPHEFDHL